MHYNKKNSANEKGPILVFGGIEFTYVDPKTLETHHVPVILSDYEPFYHEIEKEENIKPTEQIEKQFTSKRTSSLSILVHENVPNAKNQVFQTIEFADSCRLLSRPIVR